MRNSNDQRTYADVMSWIKEEAGEVLAASSDSNIEMLVEVLDIVGCLEFGCSRLNEEDCARFKESLRRAHKIWSQKQVARGRVMMGIVATVCQKLHHARPKPANPTPPHDRMKCDSCGGQMSELGQTGEPFCLECNVR